MESFKKINSTLQELNKINQSIIPIVRQNIYEMLKIYLKNNPIENMKYHFEQENKTLKLVGPNNVLEKAKNVIKKQI